MNWMPRDHQRNPLLPTISGCGVSSRPVGGTVYNSEVGVVGGKFFKSKWVNNISMSHPETLEVSDLNNDLVNSILPSFYTGANVHTSVEYDELASTEFPTLSEKRFLTNIECEQLRRFLQAENSYEGKLFWSKCLKRECPDCNLLSKKYRQEKQDVYRKLWDSVVLVINGDGSYRVKVSYIYNHNPHVIFAPQNANFQQDLAMSQRDIQQLKRKGQLDVFQKEFDKKYSAWYLGRSW